MPGLLPGGAFPVQHQAQGIVDGGRPQVVFSEGDGLDREHATEHGHRAVGVSLGAQELCQPVEGLQEIGGVRAEMRFLDGQDALKNRNGCRLIALLHLYPRQPAEVDAYFDAVGPAFALDLFDKSLYGVLFERQIPLSGVGIGLAAEVAGGALLLGDLAHGEDDSPESKDYERE
jgi:hypothetical protein